MGSASDIEKLAQAVRNPGRLILGPTSTTGSFPYGGVSLGFVSEAEVIPDARYQESMDPASGALAEVARRSVENLRIVCLLDEAWDEDALMAIFTKSTPSTGLAFQSPPETRVEGAMIPAVVPAWSPLLFAADDPNQKSVYIRRPVPRLSLRDSVRFSKTYRAGLPVVFSATPDLAWATTPPWQICRLENVTL